MFEFLNGNNFSFHTDKSEMKILFRLSSVFLGVFVLYLLTSFFIIRILSLNDIRTYLKATALSISQDFDFTDGVWNTNKYLSDISVPADDPLYIFSLDGFLIDRKNIIKGFLDTSNYTYASSFTIPKSITSSIGEHWRVVSYKIERNSQERGVILLGYFDPANRPEVELDTILRTNAQQLDSQITVANDLLDVSYVVDKEVDPNISFEIIDTFNRVQKSYGGAPAYIDKSYLQEALVRKDFTIITDAVSKKNYMLHVQPILANGETIGIVAVGKSLEQFNMILRNQLLLSGIAGFLSVIVFALFVLYIYRHDIKGIVEEQMMILSKPQLVSINRIKFDLSGSKIIINNKHAVDIPPDSYQFDICKLLFKNPGKHFDTLDIIDSIGERDEQKNVKRLVYDAVEAINSRIIKLAGQKLILHKDKTYFIHPEIASKIS